VPELDATASEACAAATALDMLLPMHTAAVFPMPAYQIPFFFLLLFFFLDPSQTQVPFSSYFVYSNACAAAPRVRAVVAKPQASRRCIVQAVMNSSC
jgi:hypothetical protein